MRRVAAGLVAASQTWAEPTRGDAEIYDGSVQDVDPGAPNLAVPCRNCGEYCRRLGGPGRRGFWFHDGGEEACEVKN